MNKRQKKKRNKKVSSEVFWRLLESMSQACTHTKRVRGRIIMFDKVFKEQGVDVDLATMLYLEDAELMDEIVRLKETDNEQQD